MFGKHGIAQRLSRRELLQATAGAGLATTLPLINSGRAAAATSRSDLIRKENAKSGTTDWMLTKTVLDPNGRRCSRIEGFCHRTSVKAGETLEIRVSTKPEARFLIDIFRLGHYQGTGGRHMKRIGPLQGKAQPEPEEGEERLRECQWETSAEVKIPDDWLSGVYVGKLTEKTEGAQSYVIFIVADDRECDFLFQCSDSSWLAYNHWPGAWSLYNDGKTWQAYCGPDVQVSLDRPYCWNWHGHKAPLTLGSGEYFLWEYPLSFWMEREGYDVSYISTVDTHTEGKRLRRGRSFLSVGHDEYWSLEMFENVKSAVDNGMHAAFFSGDTCWAVIPFNSSNTGQPHRVITRSGLFGPLEDEGENPKALAECLARYPSQKNMKMVGPKEQTLIGARNVYPYMGITDWICRDESHWLYEGTGMKDGDTIPGLIGWEWNGSPADIPGLRVVASGEVQDGFGGEGNYHATLYPGKKDNWVFNASTWWWWDGLAIPPGHFRVTDRLKGPDARVERMTVNLFDAFLA